MSGSFTYACLLLLMFDPPPHAVSPTQNVRETLQVVYQRGDFQARDNDPAPTLIYDQSFFQRFEPMSVGDMLKRLPGVTGAADAGAFERAQLHGLPARHTRILINGERVPAAASDQGVALDRLPAELVERIEIRRAPAGDDVDAGLAATINIVLKRASDQPEWHWSGGARYFENDETTRGHSAFSWRTPVAGGAFALDAVWQERANPKRQVTNFQDDAGFALTKNETNRLRSDERAVNLIWQRPLNSATTLKLSGAWLDTQRREREDATVRVNHPPAKRRDETDDGTDDENDGEDDDEGDEGDDEGVPQDETLFDDGRFNHRNLRAAAALTWRPNQRTLFTATLGHDDLRLDDRAEIGVVEDAVAKVEEIEADATRDHETRLTLKTTHRFNDVVQLSGGLHLAERRRNARRTLILIDDEEPTAPYGVFRIKQSRFDLFGKLDLTPKPNHHIQLGLRRQARDLDLVDAGRQRRDGEWFPVAHYRWQATPSLAWQLSWARTSTPPDFQNLQPFAQRNTPLDDFTTFGNPELRDESAWGWDGGFTYQFDQWGQMGLNLYQRRISDHVAAVPLDDNQLQFQNIGSATAHGLEIDFGLPLHALGLPNLSSFANLALQRSRVTDPLSGARRPFNLQVETVANAGLLYSYPQSGLGWGFNGLYQGPAAEQLFGERVTIKAHLNVEAMLEWRRPNWSLRLTARNLLDGEKRIRYSEYDGPRTEAEPIVQGREVERAGRSFFLVLRVHRLGR